MFVANAGLPIGTYNARFASAEVFESEFGPAVKLFFQVLQGLHQGQFTSRICSAKLSPKSNLFQFLQAFKCGKLAPGEQFDLTKYYGITGMITVEVTSNGGTRVGSFFRMT